MTIRQRKDGDGLTRAIGDPRVRKVLETALILERDHDNDPGWDGWKWHEAGAVSPLKLTHLVADGVLTVGWQSNRRTYYRLADAERVKAALAAAEPGAVEVPAAPELPAHMFAAVVGHDPLKDIFRRALAAPRPVHVLMTGPPGTAKSLFLEELAALPGARYILGDTSSRAGILDFLFTEQPRYLVIDELDKADIKDLSVLLSLMERGLITSMKHTNTGEVRRTVWVFAGCNSSAKLPAPLLSRFVCMTVNPYTAEEFGEICASVLVAREGCDPQLARFIARELAGRTMDVRDAVKVARLSTSPADAARVVKELWPA